MKKGVMLLTNEQQKLHQNSKIFYICKTKLKSNTSKIKKYLKVRRHRHDAVEYKGAAHSMCVLKYSVSK